MSKGLIDSSLKKNSSTDGRELAAQKLYGVPKVYTEKQVRQLF